MIDANARGAWQELEARLRPFIVRRVPTPADVDDVVQDVFLRMQRGVGGLRDDERFGPWVYQVARSAIAEHHRARARHVLADGDVPEPEAEPPRGEGGAAELLALAIGPLVAMLPTPYREALTLTELEGLSQKAAADMLGISLPAMKSRVQRGREKLRALVEQCCEVALDARGHVIDCVPRIPGNPSRCSCG
ncbi:sigma-70 family RNA polymerase sigma factor [Sorangium sp. So ce1036]|uniref:sigma-70 family RNA polymerase sigma factor n=1 Tax=Sorangium sp. So ce1036 TaxID=3133328 RepID=UPI003F0D1B12